MYYRYWKKLVLFYLFSTFRLNGGKEDKIQSLRKMKIMLWKYSFIFLSSALWISKIKSKGDFFWIYFFVYLKTENRFLLSSHCIHQLRNLVQTFQRITGVKEVTIKLGVVMPEKVKRQFCPAYSTMAYWSPILSPSWGEAEGKLGKWKSRTNTGQRIELPSMVLLFLFAFACTFVL